LPETDSDAVIESEVTHCNICGILCKLLSHLPVFQSGGGLAWSRST